MSRLTRLEAKLKHRNKVTWEVVHFLSLISVLIATILTAAAAAVAAAAIVVVPCMCRAHLCRHAVVAPQCLHHKKSINKQRRNREPGETRRCSHKQDSEQIVDGIYKKALNIQRDERLAVDVWT